MKKRKEYWGLISTIIIVIFALAFFALLAQAQEQEVQKKAVEAKSPAQPKIKVWQIPDFIKQDLQRMVDDFNRKFQERTEVYKTVLRKTSEDHKDMPEDVIMDLQRGYFMTMEDYVKIQALTAEQAKAKQAPIKKEEIKKEK